MNCHPFSVGLLIVLPLLIFSKLHGQQTGYEKWSRPQLDPVADISIPEGSDPYAIHLTGLGFNMENTFFSVVSNNAELIKAIDIQPSSNGKAYIQYALNKGVVGASIIKVKVYQGDERNVSVRSFTIRVYQKDKQQLPVAAPEDNIRLEPFPNPSAGSTTFKLSTASATDHIEVAIYNTTGHKLKTIFAGNTEAGKVYFLRIACERYARGIYFIRALSGSASNSKKLIIQ